MLVALLAAEAGVRLLAPPQEASEASRAPLGSYFTAEEIERGARFSRGQRAIGLARSALQVGALAQIVRRPPRVLSGWRSRPVAGGAVVGSALTVALSAAPLPLAALARRHARGVGLITQSWSGWGADLLKAAGIEAVLAAAGGSAMVAATRRYPRAWWAPAGAGSVVVGALLAALAPVVLDPLFNDFTPLPDGETRSDVLELAHRAGVEVGEVYCVDASRRTTAANAYVSGLGPTKRVVLFDTLLDRYSRDEVRVVVAHELAHVRFRDVPRGVLYAAMVAPAGALATQRLSWTMSSERGTPGTLPALALSGVLVSVPLTLLANRLSRALECRADAYSLDLSGAPDAFVSFERAIALQNVADLDPPRWVSSLLATHPSAGARIGAALAFKARSASTASGPS